MTENGLSDSGCRSAELRYEWQSFLGLLPVLDLQAMDPVMYQRCLTAVWRSRKSAISRTDLQQAAGLAFYEETLDFDLLVARLVREGILEPIVSSPFHFQIRRWNWTNPESVYAADDRLSLIAIGSKAAEAIRKSVEETTEAGAVQLELPLEKKRNFDLEGEAKCNQ